ncbi:MAG: hypothetical protein ACK5Q5_17910 [Planctomycetaceae bacterium]
MPLQLRNSRQVGLAALLVVAVAGCGGGVDDPFDRAEVKGTVNFEGMPLAYGEILFRGEAAKVKDELPQATLMIREGKFQSNRASKPGHGQNKVVVSVFDGDPPPPADPKDESGKSPPEPKVVGYYKTDLDVKDGEPLHLDIKKADLTKQFPE